MKFKVGDKVKVFRNVTTVKEKDEYIGKEFTIKNIYENHSKYGQAYSIGQCYVAYEQELELVSFTKADLKDGMVVEHRDGKRYVVLGDKLIGMHFWRQMKCVNDDLNDTSERLAIDKVYKTTGYTLQNLLDDKYLYLIWERPKEEPIKEMTVEEIEKELGYKVKIIAQEN